jgi:hypothetical protein
LVYLFKYVLRIDPKIGKKISHFLKPAKLRKKSIKKERASFARMKPFLNWRWRDAFRTFDLNSVGILFF